MRACPNCKASLPEGPRFCIHCGSFLHPLPDFPGIPTTVPLGGDQAPQPYPVLQLQRKNAVKAPFGPPSRSPQEPYAWGSGLFNGYRLRDDTVKDVGFLNLVAEQNLLVNLLEPALICGNGHGLHMNLSKAFGWCWNYQTTAQKLEAMYCTSLICSAGRDVPATVATWYHRTADRGSGQGEEDAAHRLGLLYANGRGVPWDDEKAIYWFQQAVQYGSEETADYLRELKARIRAKRRLLPPDPVPATRLQPRPCAHGVIRTMRSVASLSISSLGGVQ